MVKTSFHLRSRFVLEDCFVSRDTVENVVRRNALDYVQWPIVEMDPRSCRDENGVFVYYSIDQSARMQLNGDVVGLRYLQDVGNGECSEVEVEWSVYQVPKRFAFPTKRLREVKRNYEKEYGNCCIGRIGNNVGGCSDGSAPVVETSMPRNGALRQVECVWKAVSENVQATNRMTVQDVHRICESSYLPCTFLPQGVLVEWRKEATYRVISEKNMVHVTVHEDHSTVVLKNGFFQHYLHDGKKHRFTEHSIPPSTIYLGHSKKYPLSIICTNMLSLHDLGQRCGLFKKSIDEKPSTGQTLNTVAVHVEKNNIGVCTAFKDGRVRIVFSNHVILEMDAARERCQLVLQDGEALQVFTMAPMGYDRYIQRAVEFATWAFSTPIERSKLALRRRYHQKLLSNQQFKNKIIGMQLGQSCPNNLPENLTNAHRTKTFMVQESFEALASIKATVRKNTLAMAKIKVLLND